MDAEIIFLGQRAYGPILRAMQQFTRDRGPDTGDQIWIVEHEPVFTLGQAADVAHLLQPGDITVEKTDRGGQVTYHGPGQVVVYPLLDLRRRGIGPRRLVHSIEQVLIDYLGSLNIDAQRREGAPGVFVNEKKIASLGLRIRKPGCYHGLALNLDMDLSPFGRINPCGYSGLQMTQVADFCTPPGLESAGRTMAGMLDQQLDSAPRGNSLAS